MTALDQQAVEMASADVAVYRYWEFAHHADDHEAGSPIENCPICRWGCQVAGHPEACLDPNA